MSIPGPRKHPTKQWRWNIGSPISNIFMRFRTCPAASPELEFLQCKTTDFFVSMANTSRSESRSIWSCSIVFLHPDVQHDCRRLHTVVMSIRISPMATHYGRVTSLCNSNSMSEVVWGSIPKVKRTCWLLLTWLCHNVQKTHSWPQHKETGSDWGEVEMQSDVMLRLANSLSTWKWKWKSITGLSGVKTPLRYKRPCDVSLRETASRKCRVFVNE